MWGNSIGWLISAALVALCGAWLYLIANASTTTPATAFSADEKYFATIVLPTPPPSALPSHAGAERSAAPDSSAARDLYRRAIQLVLSDRAPYENFAQLGKLDSQAATQLQAVDLLLQAAAARDVKLFTDHPAEIVNYNRTKPPLEALQLLGRITIDRFGLLNQRAGNHDDATKHYQAGFALGWHLANERLTYEEFQLGIELISKASAGMASLADKTAKPEQAAALRDFDQRRGEYMRERSDPILRIVRAIDANIVGKHTGDVFQLAKRANERMWRVEAVLALGRVRHFAGAGGTAANQRVALATVTRMAQQEPDPIVRYAAEVARDMTIEQHRMQ